MLITRVFSHIRPCYSVMRLAWNCIEGSIPCLQLSWKLGTTRAVTVLHVRVTVTNAAIRPLQRTFAPRLGNLPYRENDAWYASSKQGLRGDQQSPNPGLSGSDHGSVSFALKNRSQAQTFVCGNVFELPIWVWYIPYQPSPFCDKPFAPSIPTVPATV